MKTKNVFGILLISGALLASTSCSDSFLQTNSPNEVSEGTFWQTEADALMALSSCYDALQSQNLYNDNIDGWNYGFLTRETTTDNGDHSWGDWMLGSAISKGTSATTDQHFSMYWTANYELIKCCNLLIANVDRIPMEEEKIASFKAEAIALRALGYINLTSVFRDVPYLTVPLTLAEAEAPKTLKAEIVKEVLADLETNIPQILAKGEAPTGRMTREAAYAIMGRMALFNGEWDTAIKAYKEVVGKFELFKSGNGSDYQANYADLFKEINENCDEVLLSVHFKGPGLSEGSTFSVCWGAPMNAIEASMNLCDDYYCIDGKPIQTSPLFKGSLEKGAHTKDAPDFARYENRDPRMKATLMLPGETWDGSKIYDYSDNDHKLPGTTSTCCIRKWYVPENKVNEYDGSLDFYIIRYAEVLLSMAEAMIEKGGYSQSEITPYINEVRARVGMPAVEDAEGTGLSQTDLRNIIRHERRIELAFEDLRMADLYRWGEWKASIERMQHDMSFYGFGAYERNYRGPQDEVWPIPQGEIDTNKQLKHEQHAEWK